MTGTGLVLYGGPLDGLDIRTSRKLAAANANVYPHGVYIGTERRARDGRLILTYTPTPTKEATP